jgi:hypothetical protein
VPSCVVGSVLFPDVLNFCFPDVDVALVYARILRFSVTYKIFNENCLVKYKEGTTKKRRKQTEILAQLAREEMCFSENCKIRRNKKNQQ